MSEEGRDDPEEFGGFGLVDQNVEYFTQPASQHREEKKGWLKLYIPTRTAIVLQKVD